MKSWNSVMKKEVETPKNMVDQRNIICQYHTKINMMGS